MGTKGDPPLPDFYLTPGIGVSCLHFIQGILNQDWLLAGLVSGDILVYNCTTWKLVHASQVFLQGVLWIGSNEGIVVCQGRFESLKVLEITENQEEGVHDAIISPDGVKRICLKEKTVFCIAHEGFCKGFLDLVKDFLIFAPSSCSSILVSKLKDTFIRPVSTLRAEVVFPEAKFGALTAFSKLSETSVLAGYENSDVIAWDWINCVALCRLSLAQCGTIMSLICDPRVNHCAVAGSDSIICIIKFSEDSKLELVKERAITNPGVGVVNLRQDKPILVAGGWDHRIRLFSWKNPEKCKPLAVLQFHSEAVECVTFTSTPLSEGRIRKNIMACGGKEGKISLWSIYS